MLLLRQKTQGASAGLEPEMALLGYTKGNGSTQVSPSFPQILQTFGPRHQVLSIHRTSTQNRMKAKLQVPK